MTQLFVQLAQTVTGNVITIVALEAVAAIIGFIVARLYAKSVYTPVIKGLEADKSKLNKMVDGLDEDIIKLNGKVDKLNDKIRKLETEKAEKEKEINVLSAETVNIGKYVISQAKNGEYYFNLQATNGQTILTSHMYSSKAACFSGIESVITNCSDDSVYERKQSANNKPYFVMKVANGQILGNSEMYESVAGMENGIASVKRNGPSTTVIEDLY